MTRGMGTALGLALTGVLFDLTGGMSSDPHSVARAFSLTAAFLSAVAIVAVVLSAIGARDPLHSTVLTGAE